MSRLCYQGEQFLLDQKPFRFLSGTIHYFRVTPDYWEDRLKKLRACGFNAVETYTCWNLHERQEGRFDFSGGLDVAPDRMAWRNSAAYASRTTCMSSCARDRTSARRWTLAGCRPGC